MAAEKRLDGDVGLHDSPLRSDSPAATGGSHSTPVVAPAG